MPIVQQIFTNYRLLIDAAEDGFVKPIEEKAGRELHCFTIKGDFIGSERDTYSARYNFGTTIQSSLK